MSMRSDAKELGISHSQLSRMLSGQRQWTSELYEKYLQLQWHNVVPEIPLETATKFLSLLTSNQRVAGALLTRRMPLPTISSVSRRLG